MENLRNKIKAYPLAASVGVILAAFAGSKLFSSLFSLMPGSLLFDTLHEIVSILWVLTLVLLCGYGRVYKQRGLRRTLLVMLPHFLFFFLLLAGVAFGFMQDPNTQWLPLPNILYGALMLFGIGLREESIFRGVIVNLLCEKGLNTRRDVVKVVFLSGFLFGAAHMSNIFSGVALSSVFFQCISAFVGGCLLCAYYLRGGSLWVMIALHAVQDGLGLFDSLFIAGSSTIDSLNGIGAGALFVSAIFLLATLFLLRKSSCKKIIDRHAREFPAA